MRSLRVLLVLVDPPLPFGSAVSRWFYVLVSELVERGHRVTVFAACPKPEEMAAARELFPAPRYDLRLYPFPARGGLAAKFETLRKPHSYMFGADLKADLRREVEAGYDILHLEQLPSGWVGLGQTGRAVLNFHCLPSIDLEGESLGRWGAFRRWQMHSVERRLLRAYPTVMTISDRLAAGLKRISPRPRVPVVPLGIDTRLYPYIPDGRRAADPVITMIGSMDWHPSRSAAVTLLTRLWPAIKARVPAARLLIVGWSARSSLAEYLGVPDVTIEENVPDTRPYFERTSVFVYAPSRGSGMKVKVLEAFAYGVPVVTTSEGVEGIPALDGVHAGVAEDDAGLIERTVELLHNVAAQNRQRQAARALLESHCGPKPTVDAVEAIYAEVLARPANAAVKP